MPYILRLSWAVGVLATTLVGCGAEDATDPQLLVEVQGASRAAVEGREVRITAVGEADGGWMGPPFIRQFCATDVDAFLTTPIRVEIREGTTILADVVLDRYACALDENHGNSENILITLDEDGTLHTDFDLGERLAFAGCGRSGWFTCSTAALR